MFSGILADLFSGVAFLFTLAGLKTLVMFIIAGTLIYLAISRRIIEGAPANAISTVPVMPWNAPDGE